MHGSRFGLKVSTTACLRKVASATQSIHHGVLAESRIRHSKYPPRRACGKSHPPLKVSMKRKKLDAHAPLGEQFHTLRQIPCLTNQACREVLTLLNEDDRGRGTAMRAKSSHRKSWPMLRELKLPRSDEKEHVVYYMDFPSLVQAKVDSCPLFAESLSRAAKKMANCLRVIYYTDEVVCGNNLGPQLQRKSALSYVAFLDFPQLSYESMWMTLSLCRHDEISTLLHGHHGMTAALLCQLKAASQNGFAINLKTGPELLWIKEILILGDHEEVRAMTGSKGAAAIKPCLKCYNVLAMFRERAVNHVSIAETDIKKCALQSTAGLQEVLDILRRQPNQSKLKEHESLLGWNLSALEHSFLCAPNLRDWCTIERINYDAMHEYYSNGQINQEIGLWYAAVSRKTFATLDHLTRYAGTGWVSNPGTPVDSVAVKTLFSKKLWKLDQDYRGNASATASVLGLCVAFGEEILRERHSNIRSELDSLKALHDVSSCILKMKWDESVPAHRLCELQQKHLQLFDAAYGNSHCRPKRHYSLHLPEQKEKWGRIVDCFVCERKHSHFRNLSESIKNLSMFSKSALLKLVDIELTLAHAAEKLDTTMREPIKQSHVLSSMFPGQHVTCSAAIESRGQEFVRNQIVQLTEHSAVKILCGIQVADQCYLVVNELRKDLARGSLQGLAQWRRIADAVACLPVAKIAIYGLPLFHRANDNGSICFIE